MKKYFCIFFCFLIAISFLACKKDKVYTEPHQTDFDFTTDKEYSDEELLDIMKNLQDTRNIHKKNQSYWSSKIMSMGVNTEQHCIDVTIIDCYDDEFNEVIKKLSKYPVHIHVTDHYYVMAGDQKLSEHIFKKKSDGTILEYHYDYDYEEA